MHSKGFESADGRRCTADGRRRTFEYMTMDAPEYTEHLSAAIGVQLSAAIGASKAFR
jgi:hypothetical protein